MVLAGTYGTYGTYGAAAVGITRSTVPLKTVPATIWPRHGILVFASMMLRVLNPAAFVVAVMEHWQEFYIPSKLGVTGTARVR